MAYRININLTLLIIKLKFPDSFKAQIDRQLKEIEELRRKLDQENRTAGSRLQEIEGLKKRGQDLQQENQKL